MGVTSPDLSGAWGDRLAAGDPDDGGDGWPPVFGVAPGLDGGSGLGVEAVAAGWGLPAIGVAGGDVIPRVSGGRTGSNP